ncbi:MULTISPECIES: hypothetical protein, partial [unclassified Planococcus (in: firmicutes)]|uniref:hypothetical protein n=1 Tax=unclassified Planococcus (in: firmicutes) TaxID=2662419 RepID=UPI001C60C6EF
AAITRGCIVDVLLFSFQGSCCAPCFGDLINISRLAIHVNSFKKKLFLSTNLFLLGNKRACRFAGKLF